jgi:malate synthase
MPPLSFDGVEMLGPTTPGLERVLAPDALRFVARLHREFNGQREALLRARRERKVALDAGTNPEFRGDTAWMREAEWRVAPAPRDLDNRRVEITGPVERKMMINALNSGANVFMADFEDANSPTWENVVEG